MRDTVVIGAGGRRPQPPAQPLLRTTLGHLLRRARREQNRTLADVARAARVSLPYLAGTAAVGGGDPSRGFPGTAPADIPVVVPLDAVRGRRVPGPGHGSGHARARLAA